VLHFSCKFSAPRKRATPFAGVALLPIFRREAEWLF
jgi:hypothetical protein